ncbi:MAG TPA: fatty acid desaturase [Noviherbaspirillum sp.]|jgi:beta-carotene ketolase (CrtW type)|uniref:fatty acid desaturase n=1 Tax=Noviherbaspirillum sp. TaxID=1926288 RepID=UPI002F91E759
MSPQRQGRVGLSLAVPLIAAWLGLHVYGVFFAPLSPPLLVIALVAIQTWLSVGIYIVAHDAMHGSLLPGNRKICDRIGAVAVWLYAGFTYRDLVPMHHAHHRHAGTGDDPDFAARTPSAALPWYGRFMLMYFRRRECVVMLLRVGACMLLGAPVENILLFFALPGLLSSYQLFYFGTFLPHRHGAGGAAFPDRHNARSSGYGYIASLLTCFHFGYHHEHHLRPDLPWWRLPAHRRRG